MFPWQDRPANVGRRTSRDWATQPMNVRRLRWAICFALTCYFSNSKGHSSSYKWEISKLVWVLFKSGRDKRTLKLRSKSGPDQRSLKLHWMQSQPLQGERITHGQRYGSGTKSVAMSMKRQEFSSLFNEMKNMRFFNEKIHHVSVFLTTSGPAELIQLISKWCLGNCRNHFLGVHFFKPFICSLLLKCTNILYMIIKKNRSSRHCIS